MKTTVSWNVTAYILVDIKVEVAGSSQALVMIYQTILRPNAEDSSFEDACYPKGNCGFPQSFGAKAGHHHLLTNPSQFIIHLLSYSYSLSTDSNVRASIPDSPQRPDRLWGSSSLKFNGYRGTLSPGVKRQGREAYHSPPSSAESQEWSSYTSSYSSSWRNA
jgi:hypothetical protein